MDGISIIVCCYNSALRLPLALSYLLKQVTPKNLKWEVVIVNNNSNDNTEEVALNYQKYFPVLKIVNEKKPGLNYARETGVKNSMFDIIIFCDDDNLLAENYLQYSYNLVHKTKNEGYGIWGGKIVAYFDEGTNVPEWFETEKLNYVVGKQGNKTGDISHRGYVWGAGMVLLKQVFLNTISENFPLLLLDRSGTALTSGGDSEISLRALITGYKLYYDQNLLLHHYITKEKLTQAYNSGLIKGFTASNQVLNKYKIFIHYIAGKNFLMRLYYAFAYRLKYMVYRLSIRKLTAYDSEVLKAIINKNKFKDRDFELMHNLLRLKNNIAV